MESQKKWTVSPGAKPVPVRVVGLPTPPLVAERVRLAVPVGVAAVVAVAVGVAVGVGVLVAVAVGTTVAVALGVAMRFAELSHAAAAVDAFSPLIQRKVTITPLCTIPALKSNPRSVHTPSAMSIAERLPTS